MQRVVLLVHNKAKETISLRHFNVSVAPAGLTKGVKALVSGKAPPDLSGFTDVADFVERAGYASESEGEDAAAGRVEVGQAVGRNNPANRTSRIRLHEVSPCRMISWCAARATAVLTPRFGVRRWGRGWSCSC